MFATFAEAAGICAVAAFVIAVVAVAGYALVRPFTHAHYRRSGERLWRPLD